MKHQTGYRFLMVFMMLLSQGIAQAQPLDLTVRDGSFIRHANGVVVDTRTGLEWFAGPDVDTSYYQAVAWVRGLTVAGGGWRMPTDRELNTLFQIPGVFSSITPLLKNTGSHVWPYQADQDLSLYLFRYMDPYGTRAFAVRSAVNN